LHALQEDWELCQAEFELPIDDPATEQSASDPQYSETQGQFFMALSAVAILGNLAPLTMQFSGSLAGKGVLILVDSWSSHSSVSSSVASSLTGAVPLPVPMVVRVADGSCITCSAELSNAEWEIQGHSFHSTLRII
jgi:hypothetical protein